MGYNETDNITSTIGITTSNNRAVVNRQVVEMPWPDWYEQYSRAILDDSESRAAWKEVLSCMGLGKDPLSSSTHGGDLPFCIRQHANEKVGCLLES